MPTRGGRHPKLAILCAPRARIVRSASGLAEWPTGCIGRTPTAPGRGNGQPHRPCLRPHSNAMCLPPALPLRVIRTLGSPRTYVWWRPSVARLPGPRRVRSWAGLPSHRSVPCRCAPPDHTTSASGSRTSVRSCADGPTERTGLKLRPAPSPLVLAPQNAWRDSST